MGGMFQEITFAPYIRLDIGYTLITAVALMPLLPYTSIKKQ